MWKCLIALPLLVSALCASTCVTIDGAQITARDIAQVDPAFASLAPDLPLSYAPGIGEQRIMTASEIAAWAAKAGVQTNVSASICFERPAHKLSAEEISQAIREAFPNKKKTQIEVMEVCKCRVPAGQLRFTAEGASAPAAEHSEMPVLWMGTLVSQSGSVYPVWARVRVSAPLPDVTRGSTVTVEVVNGSTRLKLKARAESNANAGEAVTLTNPSGLRQFRATVTGPGVAQIALSPSAASDLKEKNASVPVTIFRGSL